jgi:DNA-binding response OmpR family regulator
VVHAPDGETALSLHEREQPDLIILDWMLPGMDGLEVLRTLRQAEHATPVLMLTARGDEVDRVVGLEVGADDYLTKPFSMRELIARVHAMLRRVQRIREMIAADRASQVSDVIHYGDLCVDPAAHAAEIAGQRLDLSKTEFDLLYLFLRNPGRAFSRNYLLDTVWGQDYVTGDRSVDNAVSRLRKKLGAMGDSVETVWGVGYRLRPPEPES